MHTSSISFFFTHLACVCVCVHLTRGCENTQIRRKSMTRNFIHLFLEFLWIAYSYTAACCLSNGWEWRKLCVCMLQSCSRYLMSLLLSNCYPPPSIRILRIKSMYARLPIASCLQWINQIQCIFSRIPFFFFFSLLFYASFAFCAHNAHLPSPSATL